MPTPSSRRQPNFSWETDMTIEVKMPALSPTMEKGTLAKWLVSAGDMVRAGDLIAEIETDKAMMELEADEEGRIARLLVPEGTDDVAVGTVIAVLSSEDRSEEHTSELQSLMRISYAVFCLKKKKNNKK